jgi:hypothetical protein
MFVILDRFICPLAVRFCPDTKSGGNGSFLGLSDLALWATGPRSSSDWSLCAGCCEGEARDVDDPRSWLDIGEKSRFSASGRLDCKTSLDERWKTGESESCEDAVSWVFGAFPGA